MARPSPLLASVTNAMRVVLVFRLEIVALLTWTGWPRVFDPASLHYRRPRDQGEAAMVARIRARRDVPMLELDGCLSSNWCSPRAGREDFVKEGYRHRGPFRPPPTVDSVFTKACDERD